MDVDPQDVDPEDDDVEEDDVDDQEDDEDIEEDEDTEGKESGDEGSGKEKDDKDNDEGEEEDEEDKVKALAVLKELEDQLANLSEESFQMAQEKLTQEVEKHIEACIQALKDRKANILKDVDAAYSNHRKMLELQQNQVKQSIDSCKQMLATAEAVYKHRRGAAVLCWQGVKELKCKNAEVKVNFKEPLLTTIETHGEVEHTSPVSTDGEYIPVTEATVTTLVGGGTQGLEDGIGHRAQLYSPRGMCLNPFDKCLYFCDTGNHVVRKVTPQGKVTSFAGRKTGGEFSYPLGIAMYYKGNCFFVTSHHHHVIKKVTASGRISIFAGSGVAGNTDGVGRNATFSNPSGISVDQRTGTVYVCDFNTVRRITPKGVVTTLAGQDGEFNNPYDLCFHPQDQSLLVCDYMNNIIKRVPLDGGPIKNVVTLTQPIGVMVSPNGHSIFATTLAEHTVKRITQKKNGEYDMETFAGSGKLGNANGGLLECSFNHPCGIVIDDKTHTLYVADRDNSRIQKISSVTL